MWWESSADKAGEESLIKTVHDRLGMCGNGIEFHANELSYPQSKFENLRKGFPGE